MLSRCTSNRLLRYSSAANRISELNSRGCIHGAPRDASPNEMRRGDAVTDSGLMDCGGDPRAHTTAGLWVFPRQQGCRHPADPGLSRAQEHHAYGALYTTSSGRFMDYQDAAIPQVG
jgi:hypothetical protein